MYTFETSCMKWTSPRITEMWMTKLCKRVRFEILLWFYGPEKFPGLSGNGPQKRLRRLTGPDNLPGLLRNGPQQENSLHFIKPYERGTKKIWVPDRNRTNDLANTGRALYALTYENSCSARSLNDICYRRPAYCWGSTLFHALSSWSIHNVAGFLWTRNF